MPATSKNDLYRALPSVDEVLRSPRLAALVERVTPQTVAETARVVLEEVRTQIASGSLTSEGLEGTISELESTIEQRLWRSLEFSLRAVINATGVILHTNLGRAPLSKAALDHILGIAGSYSNLEFDLESGERGRRDVHAQRLFERLLGRFPYGEDGRERPQTIVVNNCAAAVMIGLNTLAEGGEVIVSRGELVEIGGSFRIPDVMTKSGVTLREVGTTNRTRIEDYERVIHDRTRLLMRVHRSNFSIVGFTEQPTLRELVTLGRKHRIPVFEDQGNGCLLELPGSAAGEESSISGSLRAGVDVISYSGDKLFGGPQAGLLTGRAELIGQIRTNPIFRALRVDKLTYAALEATLLAYLEKGDADLPVRRMLTLKAAEVFARAQRLKETVLREGSGHTVDLEIIEGMSLIGGGAAPASTLPTYLVALGMEGLSADQLQKRLRQARPPIIARVETGRVLLDLRTVAPEEDAAIAGFLATFCADAS